MTIDSKKRIEIMTSKIENPHRANTDIAKEFQVDDKSVHNIIKDIPSISEKSHKSAELLDMSLEIVNDGVSIIRDKIKELKNNQGDLEINSMNDLKQLSGTIEENFKRSQLMQGKPTDIIYTPDQWASMTPEQLEKVSNGEKIDLK